MNTVWSFQRWKRETLKARVWSRKVAHHTAEAGMGGLWTLSGPTLSNYFWWDIIPKCNVWIKSTLLILGTLRSAGLFTLVNFQHLVELIHGATVVYCGHDGRKEAGVNKDREIEITKFKHLCFKCIWQETLKDLCLTFIPLVAVCSQSKHLEEIFSQCKLLTCHENGALTVYTSRGSSLWLLKALLVFAGLFAQP